MQVIEISGQDLDVFRSELASALRGELGTITSVTATVADNGKLQLSVNGYNGTSVGTLRASASGGAQLDDRTTNANPYANIDAAEGDSEENATPLKKKDRIALLEHDVAWLKQVVTNAEQRLGVSLKS